MLITDVNATFQLKVSRNKDVFSKKNLWFFNHLWLCQDKSPLISVHLQLTAREILPYVSQTRKLALRGWLSGSCVQLLSHVPLFATLWTAARQASLSFTISQSLLKLMSIESMMPSNYLILSRHLLLLPSIFPLQGLFQWVGSSYQVAKVLEFQL